MSRIGIAGFVSLTLFVLALAGCSPEPAVFSVSDMSIRPLEAYPGEEVTISVSVANNGGSQGDYTVSLNINGLAEAQENVTLPAGGSQDITFVVAEVDTGIYDVAIDNLSDSFLVKIPKIKIIAEVSTLKEYGTYDIYGTLKQELEDTGFEVVLTNDEYQYVLSAEYQETEGEGC